MKTNRIAGVMMRHYFEAKRNFDRITDMVYWPVLDIIVWGFFTIYLAHGNHMGPDLASFLLGAAILWGLFFAFQRDMAVGFLDELWSRNLINLFSTPLTVWEYMTGLVLVNLVKDEVGFGAASRLAWAAYYFDIFPCWCRRSCRTYRQPGAVRARARHPDHGNDLQLHHANPGTGVELRRIADAGVVRALSVESLPRWLQAIAWMLPTTHSFEGMRQMMAGHGFSGAHFWWGLGLNATYFVLAMTIFRCVFASAKMRGLLVKLE